MANGDVFMNGRIKFALKLDRQITYFCTFIRMKKALFEIRKTTVQVNIARLKFIHNLFNPTTCWHCRLLS